jgi:XTP/dITP diphosphohydrolase
LASELLVATRSADKLDEIRAITGAVRMTFVTLSDIGVAATAEEDAIESFDTFVENAVAKARYFAALTGLRTLADDSGLAVAALAGGPGVRSKRFALDRGTVGPAIAGKDLDRANNELLLATLEPHEDRRAHYVSAVALVDHGGTISAVGTVSGEIARAPRGAGGFGYDPLFVVAAIGKTFAELSREQKNQISHRAVAMRAIASQLR